MSSRWGAAWSVGFRFEIFVTDPIYAKIEGNKMTIFAHLITADGHHEVQTYERILVPGGMTLNFTRARDRI